MGSRPPEPRARSAGPTIQSFPAEAGALVDVRSLIRHLAAGVRMTERTTDDVVLAVSEACTNSVLHSGSPDLTIAWKVDRGCLQVEIRDRGVFTKHVPLPEVSGWGGHGIQIMMAVMDEVKIHQGTPQDPGTIVRLTRCADR
jgi:anti-sigma regulatory factor (Ser/Thr protein kinase)